MTNKGIKFKLGMLQELVNELKAARDSYKEKVDDLDVEVIKYKVDLKEWQSKEKISSEAAIDLAASNAKYRAIWKEHELKATDFRNDLFELRKKFEVLKSGNDRLMEENDVYKK